MRQPGAFRPGTHEKRSRNHKVLLFIDSAGRYDRLRQGYLRIPIASGAITLAAGLLFLLIRSPLLRIFTRDATVLMYADRYVSVVLLGQWMFAVFNSIICIVNGVGMVRYTTVINL